MPTELNDDIGELLRFQGGEYGATTGRPRRCGWLDLVTLKHALRYGGLSSFVLTKLDVLSGFPEIKVAIAYEIDGEKVYDFPYDISKLEKAKPIYKTFTSWTEDLSKISDINKLPENAKIFVNWIAKELDIPMFMLSLGAARKESAVAHDPFENRV